MTEEKNEFVLKSLDGSAPPVLVGVKADGRLDGVLFELVLRQTYRNTGSRPLEVVYTFPLPHRAVLLGFASELNGERMGGQVVPRKAAEERYETALADGDAPVMLEASGDGLHTANIGNLNPGDEIVLEVRFAQLLAFEQGRLRLAIPTTVAPRFGDALRAGLQPQQMPLTSLDAEYPLMLSVLIGGTLAGAAIECPTHRVAHQVVEGCVQLNLAGAAWLDRDVVITIEPREPQPSLLVRASDAVTQSAPCVLMAAFQMPAAATRGPTALKVLVDCSGSMGGDSIASARVALRGVLAGLTPMDHVSLTRFGSTVEHQLAPRRCTPEVLREAVNLVNGIEADLGGTEMEQALHHVFALPVERSELGADVLLITDGEIWQAESTIEAARASGQRVFVIGVGSSPAEGVLRGLAEATGGACEFVTPGEALEAAALRMLNRLRQQPWRDIRVDWGTTPQWQSELPKGLFGGDSLIALAGVAVAGNSSAVRLLATDAGGKLLELARCEAEAPRPGDSLSRMAAARRMALLDGDAAQRLAVDYQLMGKDTHCILVHQRAEADKSTTEADLHRVTSMLAAGWGATSSAAPADSFGLSYAIGRCAPVQFSRRAAAVEDFDIQVSRTSESNSDVRYRSSREPAVKVATLTEMAVHVSEWLDQGGALDDLAQGCAALNLHAHVERALEQVAALGATASQALLLLAGWTVARDKQQSLVLALQAVRAQLKSIDAELISASTRVFETVLSGYAIDSWARPGARPRSRMQRLKAALGLASD